MPSPVLALPWASRSRTSVRRPAAASAVAKLMAVVVLPTPPFWLATATMRARRLAEKGAFPRIRLDQLNPGRAKNRQNQTGKTGAAAEIDHAPRAIGDERLQLRGIEDVPAPQIDEGISADEVDARRPPDQQRGVRLEPGKCFT